VLGWPTYGYDRHTMEMVLFVDALLAISCFVVIVMIYHWSRRSSDSPDELHGFRDGKFQARQSSALKSSRGPQEEECNS